MRTCVYIAVVLVGCGGSRTATSPRAASGDPESVFGPLEIGADYASYRKLTDKPFLSLDHGNRWVDVYVNDIGASAYDSTAQIPVGTIVVKTSFVDDGGAPGAPGPIYVMEKRAAGYAVDDGDWWFAIHWAQPPKADAAKLGGPIYWRGKSPRVDYCADCHSSYDRGLGGLIPSSILKR